MAFQAGIVDLFNPASPSLLDYIIISISFLGEWKFLLAISLLIFLKDRELAKKLLLVLFITAIFVFPLKIIIDEPRPYITHENIRAIGGYEEGGSFPSGHASFAFAYFVVLCIEFREKRRYFLVMAITIAFTRLYLGQHYPFDILAGVALGLFTGYLGLRLFRHV
jgi:undecaprenyl-diphosphatase